MRMNSSPRGAARFTLLFLVSIAVFSIFSLLMKHIMFLLLPMFGLALGLWRKGGHVNVSIRIVLVIFSIGALACLAWLIPSICVMIFFLLWLWPGAPFVLLLIALGYAANLLRRGRPSDASKRTALLIFVAVAVAFLAWLFWADIYIVSTIVFFYSPFVLSVPMPIVIGYFAAVRSLGDKKSEPQERTVGETVIERATRRGGGKSHRLISIAVFALLISVTIAGIVAFSSFLSPFRPVEVSESRNVPYEIGVEQMNLDFASIVSGVNITFEELGDKLVVLYVSATGMANTETFDQAVRDNITFNDVIDLTFRPKITDNVLTLRCVVQDQYLQQCMMPERWSSLSVACDVRIDPSMNVSLNVKVTGGDIILDTKSGVVLNSLVLTTMHGIVEANLVEGVVVAGDVSVDSLTGDIRLSWENVILTKDIQINATTSTNRSIQSSGGVSMNITQHEKLVGNVTLEAEAASGKIDFAIDILDDVGASIKTSTASGAVSKYVSSGFSALEDQAVRSSSYPACSNFDVDLKTATGGIDINARYRRSIDKAGKTNGVQAMIDRSSI